MLPTDESGEITTIENVFHSLNTRLNGIKNANIDLGDLMSGYGYNYQESIIEIENKIFGFSPTKVLGEVNYSLELINRIHESTVNLTENKDNQICGSWLNDQSHFDKIEEELSHYKLFLEKIQEELLLRLKSTETNVNYNPEKIKINITIEQLGGLVYFLDQYNIFTGSLKPNCRAMVKLFSLETGEDISPESLYNKVYESKENESVLSFWREKFKAYTIQSYSLPKRKK